MDSDDKLMLRRPEPAPARPKSGLQALLDEAATGDLPGGEEHGPSPGADLPLLPKPEHAYVAHCRVSNEAESTLHVVAKGGYSKGWPWADYGGIDLAPPLENGSGPVLLLYFGGVRPAELTIEGRNLDRLHVWLGDRRIRWIRELPANRVVRDGKEPVITRIAVRMADDDK